MGIFFTSKFWERKNLSFSRRNWKILSIDFVGPRIEYPCFALKISILKPQLEKKYTTRLCKKTWTSISLTTRGCTCSTQLIKLHNLPTPSGFRMITIHSIFYPKLINTPTIIIIMCVCILPRNTWTEKYYVKDRFSVDKTIVELGTYLWPLKTV
jgi:hypothetical protein